MKTMCARLVFSVVFAVILIPALVAGCMTTTTTNPDGSVSETQALTPFGEQMLAQATQILIAELQGQLNKPDAPPSPEQQARLNMQIQLQQAVVTSLTQAIQWRIANPGQPLPPAIADAVAAARAKAAPGAIVPAPEIVPAEKP
jgi:hypothetical protein